MYIVFDTETTGLVNDSLHPIKNLNQYPRVIELGYIILDNEFNVIKRFEALIKPNGWTVPTGDFWSKNGFTTERNNIYGFDMADVLDEFIADLEKCDYMIAHKLNFDYKIMCSEMYRYHKRASKKIGKICTLKTAQHYFKTNGINSKSNLTDLHKYFFGVGFDNSHNALADVEATVRVFAEMSSRNIQFLK